MKKGNVWALLPIGVFVVLYLALGITFEYIMKIPMGFYNVPIVIAFLVAFLVACLQNRKLNFDAKLALMGEGVGTCGGTADTLDLGSSAARRVGSSPTRCTISTWRPSKRRGSARDGREGGE